MPQKTDGEGVEPEEEGNKLISSLVKALKKEGTQWSGRSRGAIYKSESPGRRRRNLAQLVAPRRRGGEKDQTKKGSAFGGLSETGKPEREKKKKRKR